MNDRVNLADIPPQPNISASSLPVSTRLQRLPLAELQWEDFERLCIRLVKKDPDTEFAQSYGVRGQNQEGIDLYVRKHSNGRYEVWQCKRYPQPAVYNRLVFATITTNNRRALREVEKFVYNNQMQTSRKLRILVAICATFIVCITLYGYSRPYGVSGSIEAERVYKIAIQKNDVSICDKVHLWGFADLTNEEIREVCYEEYATAHPDQNICPRIDNNFRCVNASAIASLNPSACLAMEDSGERSLCVYNVAATKHDLTICNILTTPVEQEKCKGYWISNNGYPF